MEILCFGSRTHSDVLCEGHQPHPALQGRRNRVRAGVLTGLSKVIKRETMKNLAKLNAFVREEERGMNATEIIKADNLFR